MDARVQLVFLGEVHSGFRLDEVKRSLGQLLKLDDARLAQLFSGARTVIKRSLQAHEAQRYVEHLAKLGARIHIEPMPATAEAAVAAPTVAPLPAAAPAEEEIVCPTCGERQSKRILCRSCATNMPMGIAAKLEAEQEARAARQAAIEARRRPASRREPKEVLEADPDAPSAWGLGLGGRIARLPYATANVWLMTFLFLLAVYVLQRPTGSRTLLLVLGAGVIFLLSMRLAVLRCHDCDRNGWWSLFLLVPTAGTLASLVLSLMPGTHGDNDHGGVPRPGRWLWLLLAVVGFALAVGLSFRTVLALVDKGTSDAPNDDTFVEADEVSAAMPNAEAAQLFRNDYSLSPRNKAFAVSSGGSWGWKSGASTVQEAMRGALAACDENRKAYTANCELVNVNGQWAGSR